MNVRKSKPVQPRISRACSEPGFKAGFYLKAAFWLSGYYGSNANISFTFQAVKNLSTHLTYLCFRLFCKFWGYVCAYLGINSFSQRIIKNYENGKFGRFDVVLKLEFKV